MFVCKASTVAFPLSFSPLDAAAATNMQPRPTPACPPNLYLAQTTRCLPTQIHVGGDRFVPSSTSPCSWRASRVRRVVQLWWSSVPRVSCGVGGAHMPWSGATVGGMRTSRMHGCRGHRGIQHCVRTTPAPRARRDRLLTLVTHFARHARLSVA